jgi:hypothetical protein
MPAVAKERTAMEICHPHNLSKPLDMPKPYGIRVSMRPSDTFARLLGSGWHREHWYATREERDAALKDMAGEHVYSRAGDKPTLVFESVEK